MSAELIGILGVGADLARVQLRGGCLANDHVYHWIIGAIAIAASCWPRNSAGEPKTRLGAPSDATPREKGRSWRLGPGVGVPPRIAGTPSTGRVRISACWIVSWLRALDGRVSHVEQRMARLEGLI